MQFVGNWKFPENNWLFSWNPVTLKCGLSLFGICGNPSTSHNYNCPAPPSANFVYTDDFGRTKILPFIAAAGGDLAQVGEKQNE